ncbi:MAG: DUF4249 domain-containing protein [Bacteroidetes bacterium]|nr:DUF4249 domain-containing protein [Bacteroidota bacterium]
MKKNIQTSFISLTVLGFLFFSCEKTIYPNLENAQPILVVNAWLNNKPEKQSIQLTVTQPYFDASTPTGVSGASVTVMDDFDSVFTFVEDGTNSGTYQWTPASGKSFGAVGRKYSLTVTVNGEIFTSSAEMKRTTSIDSITFSIIPTFVYPENTYIADFWANDPKGTGDTYWIKAYKNGVFLNKPSEINVAYDASTSSGADVDDVTFVPPIREWINPVDKDPNNSNQNLPPYVSGDSVYVEIHSISLAAFQHLQQIVEETDRPGGFGQLFAKPINNVSTNVFNTNPGGSKVVGFFNVSAVKGLGKKFDK